MDRHAQAPITALFSTPVMALHAAATTLDSTNRFDFAIRSKLYTKAALSTAATPTTDVNTGVAFVRVGTNTGCMYLIGLDSGGNIKVAQGAIWALDASGLFIQGPDIPALPDTVCPVAYVICKAGSTAAAQATGWLFGTSNFSGVTGITLTVQDISMVPDRIQVA